MDGTVNPRYTAVQFDRTPGWRGAAVIGTCGHTHLTEEAARRCGRRNFRNCFWSIRMGYSDCPQRVAEEGRDWR